jgi:hypothetical protein
MFKARSARLAALVIALGACIKVYLIYLMVIPALMRKDVRLALLAGSSVLLVYFAQWKLDPELFLRYTKQVLVSSQSQGYVGASSMQLGSWLAQATGRPLVRTAAVAVVALLLLWRSRHLVRAMLFSGYRQGTDTAQFRLLALLLLALAALSPRVTSYDFLVLIPIAAILLCDPRYRAQILNFCVALPRAFRIGLISARFDPVRNWLQVGYGLDYNTLFSIFLFATWCAITALTWISLDKKLIGALIGDEVQTSQKSPNHVGSI